MTMQGQGAPFNGDTFIEQEFIALRDKYGVEAVIETGTYHGDTTLWLSDNFKKVLTIEVNKNYYDVAASVLSERENVIQYFGDSSKDLKNMILDCPDDSRLIIFLDGHWYKNPVLKELEQIAEGGIRPIIVIHDMKNPHDETMGYDEYPEQNIVYTFEWLKDGLDSIYGANEYRHYFNKQATGARRGCLYVIPRT